MNSTILPSSTVFYCRVRPLLCLLKVFVLNVLPSQLNLFAYVLKDCIRIDSKFYMSFVISWEKNCILLLLFTFPFFISVFIVFIVYVSVFITHYLLYNTNNKINLYILTILITKTNWTKAWWRRILYFHFYT